MWMFGRSGVVYLGNRIECISFRTYFPMRSRLRPFFHLPDTKPNITSKHLEIYGQRSPVTLLQTKMNCCCSFVDYNWADIFGSNIPIFLILYSSMPFSTFFLKRKSSSSINSGTAEKIAHFTMIRPWRVVLRLLKVISELSIYAINWMRTAFLMQTHFCWCKSDFLDVNLIALINPLFSKTGMIIWMLLLVELFTNSQRDKSLLKSQCSKKIPKLKLKHIQSPV